MKRKIGVYKIQSKIKPERVYIGSAIDIKHRWYLHRWHLKQNIHHSMKLQRHVNKYGMNDLIYSVLHEVDEVILRDVEQYYLDGLNPYFNNSPKATGGGPGHTATEEEKKNQSLRLKGRHLSPETEFKKGGVNYWLGKKRPNLSKKMKGVKKSEEHKEKIRQSMMGKKNALRNIA